MPSPAAELGPLNRLLLALLAAGLVGAAVPAAAQDADASTARVRLIPEIAATRIAETWIVQAGGEVSLRATPWLSVGGAGRVGLRHPAVPELPAGVEMRFGYGGVRLTAQPPTRHGLVGSLLIGAGNVDVRETTAGGVLDSDNGLVVEPALGFDAALVDRVRVGLAWSWRFARGFDAVGAIDAQRLSGPGIALRLVIGPF